MAISTTSDMSTKKKKVTTTGVRYSLAEKKEVVDFVKKYNSENGRGGQSAASAKFKVTPLTISTWLSNAGVKAPKKAAKVAKSAKASKAAGTKGVRYSPEKKQQVVDFVVAYNDKKGRGGQNQAAKKFKISVLTVSAWLKAAGVKKVSKKVATKAVKKVAKKAAKKVAKKAAKKVAKKAAKKVAKKAGRKSSK